MDMSEKNQKQDRRVRKTQKLLKDSLIQLMKVKEFKNISVKDITERADLNRGTFYLHYQDTFDLLQKTEAEILHDFQEMIDQYVPDPDEKSLKPILNPIVDYIRENAEICIVLFENQASNDFVNRFHELIRQNGQNKIKQMYPNADPAAVIGFFEFVTYGLIGMIKQWIDMHMEQPNNQLVDLADRAIVGSAYAMLLTK